MKSVYQAYATTIQDSSLNNGIITQANAVLAALLSDTIVDIDFHVDDAKRTGGTELSVLITADSDGATITNPYKITVLKAASSAALLTAIQAWMTANPTYFLAKVLSRYSPDSSRTGQYYALIVYNESATDGPKNFPKALPEDSRSLEILTPSTSRFYAGGFYDAPAADANLSEASASQTYGTANHPYNAAAFAVAGGAGTVDAGVVGLRVTGTSVDDEGTATAGDTEVLSADITALAADQYLETAKKWVGQVTFELYVVSGAPTTYSLDFNYGFARYESFDGDDFILDAFDLCGQAGAAEATFDVTVFLHSSAGWTYDAAAFVPGGSTIAVLSTDYGTAQALDNGKPYGYKRKALAQMIQGSNQQGIVVGIDTPSSAAALGNAGIQVSARRL